MRSAAVEILIGSVAFLMRMAASRLDAVRRNVWMGLRRALMMKSWRRANTAVLVGRELGLFVSAWERRVIGVVVHSSSGP